MRQNLVMVVLLVAAGGCSGELPTQYGSSKGRSAAESINGFTSLRESFHSNAWQTQDIRRLNDRLDSLDTILWTPTTHRAADAEAFVWFEQWLSEGRRTLILVMPDQGSELDYWRLAKDLAPPEQRLEYRRRYARTLARLMTEAPGDGPVIDRTWFQAQRRMTDLPGWDIFTAPSTGAGGTSPGQPLVVGRGGTTLLLRIVRPSSAGAASSRGSMDEDSQILVVAGGSQVNNFALTQPWGQEVAAALLVHSEQASDAQVRRVGFLHSGAEGVPIGDPAEPTHGAGMELLTLYPLSLVTMHLALMGVVACLILLPIFGRPRRLPTRPANDFADHIHAMAVLMNRSGGEAFARLKISEYFRRIRGETAGPWILPEPPSAPLSPPQHRPNQPPPRPMRERKKA